MKNFKFLFVSLLLVAFMVPNVVNAQSEESAVSRWDWNQPHRFSVQIVGQATWHSVCTGAEAMQTPSGKVKLKAEFDMNGLVDLKDYGKTMVKVNIKNTQVWIGAPLREGCSMIVNKDGVGEVILHYEDMREE